LAEVIQLLMNRGYKLGKLSPDRIVFKERLGEFEEDYVYANYIAVANNAPFIA
jgi:hypothetical protein